MHLILTLKQPRARDGPRAASFFFGARIRLGAILGRFSINYFSGLGLRIMVRVWVMVRVRVRVWVRVRVMVRVGVRVSDMVRVSLCLGSELGLGLGFGYKYVLGYAYG